MLIAKHFQISYWGPPLSLDWKREAGGEPESPGVAELGSGRFGRNPGSPASELPFPFPPLPPFLLLQQLH